MQVDEILKIIPSILLEELAIETGVNRYSKKLQGPILFKLLIHSILSHKDNSLRGMESAYESLCFNALQLDENKNTIRFSSISERLKTMNYQYFEKLFYKCVELFGNIIGENTAILTRFDSTIVSASSKLLMCGYSIRGASEYLKQLKFTIGFSEIPTSADFYPTLEHVNENIALRESILSHAPSNENSIRVFDRGLQGRKTFEKFTNEKIPFVTRLKTNSTMKEITENVLKEPEETKTLVIYSDRWVHLYKRGGTETIPFRCIKSTQKETEEQIWFITNIHELTALEIAAVYKRRWDIENFFKFLKQELNLSHLINRSENGIKIILYSTLIAAILLIVYKKTNNLKGYKIMRQKFVQDMEKLLAIDLVFLCNGDTEKARKILFNTS
jgi:Transposase DDE domain